VIGASEAAPTCAVFAATWPARIRALVLYGGIAKARPTREELTEWGVRLDVTVEELERRWALIDEAVEHWGEGRAADLFMPSALGELQRRFWAIFERASTSPAMAKALYSAIREIDITAVLPTITVPTLILHRIDDFVPVANSRYMARLIPDARLVELPGRDHVYWVGNFDPIVEEIQEFLTGTRHMGEIDRVLATVLFTDIVGSTDRAAELGDRGWSDLLEAHHAAVRKELHQFRGHEIDVAGDGFLATFDGPARAIRCAKRIVEAVHSLGLEIRAGIHTGECERLGDRIGGLAVHIGARVAAKAAPGEVLVSSTVKDLLVGSEVDFTDRGRHELKGVPGEWQLFAVGPEIARRDPETLASAREDHMKLIDRAVVGLAKRAPRAMRFAARVSQRS
jgi:class 3 adenylate cyclase